MVEITNAERVRTRLDSPPLFCLSIWSLPPWPCFSADSTGGEWVGSPKYLIFSAKEVFDLFQRKGSGLAFKAKHCQRLCSLENAHPPSFFEKKRPHRGKASAEGDLHTLKGGTARRAKRACELDPALRNHVCLQNPLLIKVFASIPTLGGGRGGGGGRGAAVWV